MPHAVTTAGLEPAVRLWRINKRFGRVQANCDVDLSIEAGTVHGIIGENGAGKSTLMSILHGFYPPDSGEIHIDGRRVEILSSRDAIGLGIEMVHQHFMLIDRFTVLENVMLGAEGGPFLRPAERRVRTELAAIAAEYGLAVDPDARIADLSLGAQQRVEILRALYRGARILILDEPTAVLTPQETDELFRIVAALRAQGRTVVIITHKLREIMAITDRVSVMRAGRLVATKTTSDTTPDELGALMIGARLAAASPRTERTAGPVRLTVRGLTLRGCFEDIDLDLRAGEIVGIAGVAGNGQGDLLETLAGMRVPESGEIRLDGRPVLPGARFDPAALRRAGLSHIPEDRLRYGLLRRSSAAASAILGHQSDPALRRHGLLSPTAVDAHAARLMTEHDVRPASPRIRSALLSGGNQQKLVLARELERNPTILLVGQPTRGVDLGGIDAIHRRLRAARDAGAAILLVSVELDELRALADRILVMSQGRITGEIDPDADERTIGLLMAGVAA